MKKFLYFALVFTVLLLSTAPTFSQDDTVVIGYAAPELTGGQGVIQSGLVNHAEAMGWEVILANANFDTEAQANQIDNFIAQGVDAIVTVPVDSQAICASVQRAADAGIPFYTIDRAPIGCEINLTIQSDNFLAGQQSGEAIVALLTEKYGEPRGLVLELQGDLGQNVAQLRGGGFHDVVDQYPEIEVIQRPTEWKADVASQATLDVAAANQLDAIYMHSDCNAGPPVLAALEQLGQLHPRGEEGHIILAGIDGCPVALQAIRDGYMDQSSSQPLPDFGIIVRWIEQELNGQTIEPGEIVEEGALWSPAVIADTDTGLQANLSTTSVTPDNVDEPALWGNQDVEDAGAAETLPPLEGVVIGYAAPELTGGQGVIQSGLVNHAEAMGWEVILANANFDTEAQANQIDNFIAQGVDAIVTVPVDSQAICASVQRAADAGIPFYTIDRAPIGCEINLTIQSDNFLAGQQSGEAIVALLTEKYGEPRGLVLELQGDLGQNVAQLRGGGFHDVVDQYPEIEVIQRPTEWKADVASQATLDVAAANQLDAIYMHSDCNAGPPVLAALEQLGQLHPRGEEGHIILAGIDGCPVALQAIRDGYMDQSSSQPLPDFGIIVRWIEQELNGQTIEPGEIVEEGALWSPAVIADTDTGLQANLSTTSVTPDNVDEPALWGNQDVEGS